MLKWQGLLALSFSVAVKYNKDSFLPLSLSWASHLPLPQYRAAEISSSAGDYPFCNAHRLCWAKSSTAQWSLLQRADRKVALQLRAVELFSSGCGSLGLRCSREEALARKRRWVPFGLACWWP